MTRAASNLASYVTRAAKMVQPAECNASWQGNTVRTKMLHAGIFDSAVNPPADPETRGKSNPHNEVLAPFEQKKTGRDYRE